MGGPGGGWDPARGGVLELPPPGTAAVSKHQTISGTQHEGACSRGGGPGGGLPPSGTAAVFKHQTISGTQHEGACSAVSTLPRTNLASLYLYANPHFREQI